MSFLILLGLVVLQKSSFYYSKTTICDDVAFQKEVQSNGKDMPKRGANKACEFQWKTR